MSSLGRLRLVRALKARDDAKRWKAATALSQVDDPRTLRRVERLLEKRGHDQGRAAAAYVLGFSGETDVSDVLARRLADTDESPLVRAHAAEALGHLLQYQQLIVDIRTAIVSGFWSSVIVTPCGREGRGEALQPSKNRPAMATRTPAAGR